MWDYDEGVRYYSEEYYPKKVEYQIERQRRYDRAYKRMREKEKEENQKEKWISVKDRLPEPFMIVFVSGTRVESIFVESKGQRQLIDSKVAPFVSQDFMNSDKQWDFYDNITHWAEIEYPDSPKDNEI